MRDRQTGIDGTAVFKTFAILGPLFHIAVPDLVLAGCRLAWDSVTRIHGDGSLLLDRNG